MIYRNNPAQQAPVPVIDPVQVRGLLCVGTATGPDLRFGAPGYRHRRWWAEAEAVRWEHYRDAGEAAYAERVATVLETPRYAPTGARLQAGSYARGGGLWPELELEEENYSVAAADHARYRSLRLLASRKWDEALGLWRRGRREEAAWACDWINYFGAELQKISTVTDQEFEKMLAGRKR